MKEDREIAKILESTDLIPGGKALEMLGYNRRDAHNATTMKRFFDRIGLEVRAARRYSKGLMLLVARADVLAMIEQQKQGQLKLPAPAVPKRLSRKLAQECIEKVEALENRFTNSWTDHYKRHERLTAQIMAMAEELDGAIQRIRSLEVGLGVKEPASTGK